MASATTGPIKAPVDLLKLEPTSAQARPFFHRVESLRGLGALAIAGYHFSGAAVHGVVLFNYVPLDRIRTLQDALARLGLALLPGHAALMIFFVISGFVLRLSLEYGPQKVSTATGKFFLARLFRIYPIVIFAVVLTAILCVCHLNPHGHSDRPLTAPVLIGNLCLLDVSMNGTLWALQVELLMAPVILLLYFLERRSGPFVLLGVAFACTALAYWSRWAVWPPFSTNVFPFVLGMVVPTLGRRWVTRLSRRGAAFCTVGVITALMLTNPFIGLFSRGSAVIEAYAATALVSIVAYRLDVSMLKWLDFKAFRLLGLSSGSYYVLHMATVSAAPAIAEAIIPRSWSADCPALVGFLVLPIWLVAIAPLALCGFHLIEAPGVALGRRVIGLCRLDGRPFPRSVSQPSERRVAA